MVFRDLDNITHRMVFTEATTGGALLKKAFLKISQYSQAFSCEYCKIFKNTYFEEHLRMAASALMKWVKQKTKKLLQNFQS